MAAHDHDHDHQDKALWPPVDPLQGGLRGRCPRCGQGRLFDGFLKPAPACAVCRLDYAFIDSGDGPAVFVILVVGFLVAAMAAGFEMSYAPPLWLHILLWIPLALVLSLVALRLAKGVLINLQYRNKAAEGRIDR